MHTFPLRFLSSRVTSSRTVVAFVATFHTLSPSNVNPLAG